MTLRCVSCGHDNQPGPATCEKCGASLKGSGSVITHAGAPGVMAVRIVDVNIPFGQIVYLLLQVTLAAIPAAMVVAVVLGVIMGVLASIG